MTYNKFCCFQISQYILYKFVMLRNGVILGTSLLVEWLKLLPPNEESGFNPWSGNYILHAPAEKILHAATKMWHSQINNFFFQKK